MIRNSKDLTAYSVDYEGAVSGELDDALDYYDGYANKDRTLLENALIDRYATAVRSVPNADGDGIAYQEYQRADVKDSIQKGRQELILTRFFRRVVNNVATLQSEKSQRYTYTDESGEAVEGVEEVVKDFREAGDYRRSMIRADRLSVALGSSLLYVYYQGGKLAYQPVSPQCVYPLYAPTISDDEGERITDTLNIDEATAWVIKLGYSGTDALKFVAYFGESDVYPQGRCVQFSGSNYDDIPSVGSVDDNVVEYMWGDEPANPLTVLRQQQPEYADQIPEYPLAIFLGSDAGIDSVPLPTTGLSLYKDAREIDMAWSRLAMTSLKSARGVYVLDNPKSQPLPRVIDEGVVVTHREQTLSINSVPSANSKDAAEVISQIQQAIAEAWNVPAHEVVTGAGAPESGVALYIRSQPKIKFRQERELLNKDTINRVFDIERALLFLETGQEVIPWTVQQQWTAGEWLPPITDKERLEGLTIALQQKAIDYVEFVRQYHRLATADEALSLIEQMAERSKDLPRLPGTQQQAAPSSRQAVLQRLKGNQQ